VAVGTSRRPRLPSGGRWSCAPGRPTPRTCSATC
jgi:hypothetical protein